MTDEKTLQKDPETEATADVPEAEKAAPE